jgi:hypothetical protein
VHVSSLAASASAGVQEPVSADHSRTEVRSESDQQVGLAWLLKLRWGAVGGQLAVSWRSVSCQLAVLAFVRVVLDVDLPYLALVGLRTERRLSRSARSSSGSSRLGQGLTRARLPNPLAVLHQGVCHL